jgi:hypothetical protein
MRPADSSWPVVQRPQHRALARVQRGSHLGVAVNDLLYVAVTIVVFAVLFLLIKGVERIER